VGAGLASSGVTEVGLSGTDSLVSSFAAGFDLGSSSLDDLTGAGRIPSSFGAVGIDLGPSSLGGSTGTGFVPSSHEVARVNEGSSFGGLVDAARTSSFSKVAGTSGGDCFFAVKGGGTERVGGRARGAGT